MIQRIITHGILVLLFLPKMVFSQHEILNFTSYKTWPFLKPEHISNDGKFIAYFLGTTIAGDTLWIQALDTPWKKGFYGAFSCIFTEDSRRLIFMLPKDSLGILDLKSGSVYYFTGVANFVTPKAGNGRWLAYLVKQRELKLILLDLVTLGEKSYEGIRSFGFDDDGQSLWMEGVRMSSNGSLSTISWLDLPTGKVYEINRGTINSRVQYDRRGSALLFLAEDSMGSTVRYYKKGMDSAVKVVELASTEMEISISRNISFNNDGDKIYFAIQKRLTPCVTHEIPFANLDIRSYEDELRQSKRDETDGPFWCFVNINNAHRFVQLEHEGEHGGHFGVFEHREYLVFYKRIGKHVSSNRSQLSIREDLYLKFLYDTSANLIMKGVNYASLTTSTTGKYVTWFDRTMHEWFVYNIKKRAARRISSGIKPLFMTDGNIFHHLPEVVGWLENDSALIIEENYDLWQMDPEGLVSSVNLTHGYGASNNIEFRYIDFNKEGPRHIHKGDTLILAGFSFTTKENGFFALIFDGRHNFETLRMEPRMYYYEFPSQGILGSFYPLLPMKAKFADKYIVERMSATEYPNLYLSDDLRVFHNVTDLQPQRQFNWYTTELYRWILPDGRHAEGVIYKPEDFNVHLKYPIIFFYYEKFPDALHEFIQPVLSIGIINIPWFTSHGYLVFVPDIYYTTGHTGASAYNYVVSAARSLSKQSFIDSKHMGLQGHSFAGFETDYIVSHSTLFAAAASCAGTVDLIGDYGMSISYYEDGQGRMGASLWARPDLYVKNSPLVSADKVMTPLLIMHNDRDESVPFNQGQEWFNGLARLGKQVWMLTYRGEGHVIENDSNRLDFSIRMGQFFDHFLKGAQMPKWMTEGLNPGLELDYSGAKP